MNTIFEKAPKAPNFNPIYNADVIFIPVFYRLPDGREILLLNRLAEAVDDEKKNDPQIVLRIEEDKRKVQDFATQLEAHDHKWYDRFSCDDWQPKEVKGMSPTEFIAWVESKGLRFNYRTDIWFYKNGEILFQGDLEGYSCAFCFNILDKGLIQELLAYAEKKHFDIWKGGNNNPQNNW